jgi:hypothetical protein
MAAKVRRFTVRLDPAGKYGEVASLRPPFDVEQVFGARGRVAVKGTINGKPYRSSLFKMRGCHFMVVNQGMRAQAKCGPGDTVRVTMEPDTGKRRVALPAFLKRELAGAKLMSAWKKLSFTQQKEYVREITGAKKRETRDRRIATLLSNLRAGRRKS